MTLSGSPWDFQCGILMCTNVSYNAAMKEVLESTLASSFGQPADEQTQYIFHNNKKRSLCNILKMLLMPKHVVY